MPEPQFQVDFASLPVAAILLRSLRVIAVNAAYEALMGITAEQIVGQRVDDLVLRYVMPTDLALAKQSFVGLEEGSSAKGTLFLRANDGSGRSRELRVVWTRVSEAGTAVVYLIDEERDVLVKEITDSLARVAAGLTGVSSEQEVLERAVSALVERGFAATFVLVKEGEPKLAYGPSGSPVPPERKGNARSAAFSEPLSLDLLRRLNPHFDEGRAVFFQDFDTLVESAFSSATAEAVKRARPGRFAVQVPLLRSGSVYGALFVTADTLSPALGGPLEMFGELVVRAVESVRLQREVLAHERLAALGEAAAVRAHEVRNPIGAILNAVTLLRRDAGDRGLLLSMIAEESRRLDRIVSDLLALGRPLLPKLVSIDILVLAEVVADVLRAREGATEVAILVAPAERRELVLIDPDLAQLALLNVLRNAVQASPVGSAVRVSLEPRDGGFSALCVDDAGPGFSSDVAARMFEPFYTTRAAGTGVGLALVRRVVDACHGRIEIGRSALGGARFALLFKSAA